MNDEHYAYHHHIRASQQVASTQSPGVPLPSTTHCGVNVSVTGSSSSTRDLYTESGDISSPYGTLDPHYRVPYSSVYCTNSGYNTNSGPIIGGTLQVRNNGANGNISIGQASPSLCTNTYTSSIYSTNQRYITTPNSNTIKQGSLATHV